jgi:hypothetical protein
MLHYLAVALVSLPLVATQVVGLLVDRQNETLAAMVAKLEGYNSQS